MTPRGEDRRQTITKAAAAIVHESGPSTISHRSVTKRAGYSLSATAYYFDGLEDLLRQAGLVSIGLWTSRTEHVADRVKVFKSVPDAPQRVRFTFQATLPAHDACFGHYLQLISASQTSSVKHAYHQGRQCLDVTPRRVLRQLDNPLEPEMVIAVVGGATVTTLSKGWNIKPTTAGLLTDLISLARGMPPFQAPGGTASAASSHDSPASSPAAAVTGTADQCAVRAGLLSPRIFTTPSPQTGGVELSTDRLLTVGRSIAQSYPKYGGKHLAT